MHTEPKYLTCVVLTSRGCEDYDRHMRSWMPGAPLFVTAVLGCHGSGDAPSTRPDASARPQDVRDAPAVTGSVEDAAETPGPPPPVTEEGRCKAMGGEARPTFRRAALKAPDLTKAFAGVPALARLGEVRFFDPADGSYLVRSTAPHEGVVFTTTPVLFSPEPGVELVVATGRGKSSSFIAALCPLGEDGLHVASYLILLGETAPVALAYWADQKKLLWTTCWMCPGEQGSVSWRDEHRVVIVQQ